MNRLQLCLVRLSRRLYVWYRHAFAELESEATDQLILMSRSTVLLDNAWNLFS